MNIQEFRVTTVILLLKEAEEYDLKSSKKIILIGCKMFRMLHAFNENTFVPNSIQGRLQLLH